MITEAMIKTMQISEGRKSTRKEIGEGCRWVRTERATWMTGGVTRIMTRKSIMRRYSPIRKVLKRHPKRMKVIANIVMASIISHWALRTLRLTNTVARGQKRAMRPRIVSPVDTGVISV
jgi:hypothetical protein